MPVSQTYKLCPDAAFLPVNIRLYVQVSDNVMEIMKGFAEKFQQYSIDEAFLVPGPDIKSFDEAALYALRIKDEIKRTAMQLLSEFIGSQKIRLVGVGVSRLRERDARRTLITDFV